MEMDPTDQGQLAVSDFCCCWQFQFGFCHSVLEIGFHWIQEKTNIQGIE